MSRRGLADSTGRRNTYVPEVEWLRVFRTIPSTPIPNRLTSAAALVR